MGKLSSVFAFNRLPCAASSDSTQAPHADELLVLGLLPLVELAAHLLASHDVVPEAALTRASLMPRTSPVISSGVTFHVLESVVAGHVAQVQLCHVAGHLVAEGEALLPGQCGRHAVADAAVGVVTTLCCAELHLSGGLHRAWVGAEVHVLRGNMIWDRPIHLESPEPTHLE